MAIDSAKPPGCVGCAEPRLLDLSSFASVRAFCEGFLRDGSAVDVLVNNAGILMGSADGWMTADGLNRVMQVNYLAHYALTLGLLPALRRARDGARIINLSSHAHYAVLWRSWVSRSAFESVDCTGLASYPISKLCMILFTHELARKLASAGSRVTVNAVDPDSIRSSLYDHLPWPMYLLFRPFLPLMGSCDVGASTSVYLAHSADVEGVTGAHYFRSKPVRSRLAPTTAALVSWPGRSSPHPQLVPSRLAQDSALAHELWCLSQELCEPFLVYDASELR